MGARRDGEDTIKCKPFYCQSIRLGQHGVLCSAAAGKEIKAAYELRALFEEWSKKIYPNKLKDDRQKGKLEEELEKELEELRNEAKGARQFKFDVIKGVRCVFFVTFPDSISPIWFIHRMLEDLNNTGSVTRYTQKITPIATICAPDIKEIEENIKPIIDEQFNVNSQQHLKPSNVPDESSRTWMASVRIRYNNTVTKEDITKVIGSLVPPNNTVDLKYPSTLITVNIIRQHCFIGACRNYTKLSKYNISKVC